MSMRWPSKLDAMGAKYFVFTLGQNSGYFNAPNREYEQVTGYAPGTRCSERDLPLDLYRVLDKKGIRLMLYLPCQTPNRDVWAQAAFGLPQGPKDQPIDLVFARKWARVIQEWSDRYGDKVCGWWFDGAYQHVQFNEEIAGLYAAAAKHGNPRSIVTFNPGVRMIHYTEAEDYTAGELNDPFDIVPESRWLDRIAVACPDVCRFSMGPTRRPRTVRALDWLGTCRGGEPRRPYTRHGTQHGSARRSDWRVRRTAGGAGQGDPSGANQMREKA